MMTFSSASIAQDDDPPLVIHATAIAHCPAGCRCYIVEPADCPSGVACLPSKDYTVFSTQEAASIDSRLAYDEARIAQLRVGRVRRFGWTAGLGMSCGYDFVQAGVMCLPGVSATWGLRF